jgi:hypothetical protein
MIEYRFRVSNAAVFTLYSYSKALEYHIEYATADSLMHAEVGKAKDFLAKQATRKSASQGDLSDVDYS